MTVICTVANEQYKPGAVALMRSIKKNNPSLKFKSILMSYDMKECEGYETTIKYEMEDFAYLRKLPTKPRLRYAWDKFHIWTYLQTYDRVIFLDSDMICIGDISDLLSDKYDDYDFVGVSNGPEKDFNTGLMLLNKSILNDAVWDKLWELAINYRKYDININNGDETIINYLIRDEMCRVGRLPINKWMLSDDPRKEFNLDEGKFIHYVVHKPWILQGKYNDIWQKYFQAR